ncbi:glycine-rich cell wall structural protein 1-like [Prunus avium]|uniref:Glycine-rich cell wall structural protein 1-like n=1 Tax=Prunus avium TaxID=42229 RepID=A0A6P5RQ09_PRUAV|nr:glycine-rich cell wall structural protein 1-like [Prunus avium]XP_021828819.1 glycine-rich cell wall structural protein 1-like [Prunus avium]
MRPIGGGGTGGEEEMGWSEDSGEDDGEGWGARGPGGANSGEAGGSESGLCDKGGKVVLGGAGGDEGDKTGLDDVGGVAGEETRLGNAGGVVAADWMEVEDDASVSARGKDIGGKSGPAERCVGPTGRVLDEGPSE